MTFRLAHVSDLHLAVEHGQRGWNDVHGWKWFQRGGLATQVIFAGNGGPLMSTYEIDYLKALVRALTAQSRFTRNGYDGILLTGDVATTGRAADQLQAQRLLSGEELPGAAASLGSAVGANIPLDRMAIMPGNHDRYAGRWLTPNSAEFERQEHFGSYWPLPSSSSNERADVSVFMFPPKVGARLAVVLGDFSYTGTPWRLHKYLGCGKASKRTRDKMVETTQGLQADGVAVVWGVHYPPTNQQVDQFLRLENPDDVAEAAGSANVNVIFCGHTHEANVFRQAGFGAGIRIICAATPTGASEGNRSYLEVEIEVSRTKPRVRVGAITEMIYSRWAERIRISGEYGNGAEFCPAP